MRFVCDECVDARVARVLFAAGHDAWTIPMAGLSSEDDDEVSVYAHNQGAVLVTDDKELRKRRSANLFGKTLFLRCPKPSAVATVAAHLESAIGLLQQADDVVVTVSADGAWISAPEWLKTPRPEHAP